MHLQDMAPIRFLLNAVPLRLDKRLLGIAALSTVFILFGDLLFPLLAHGLYLMIEFIEQETENLLEWAFGVSTREAQILIVWVGLPVISFWCWRLLRKPLAAVKARWAAFKAWVNGDWSLQDWFRILSFIAALSTILYFMV